MTQDDAHIFCRPDQLVDELLGVIDMAVEFYKPFGLTVPRVELSTKPGKAIGTPEMWAQAEEILRVALDRSPYEYSVAAGEGAFYGPKADFHFRDSIGRWWQLTTVQVDFSTPERFGLEFIGSDNTAHRPVMVHRALYGAVERFFAVLLEHSAGALPPWLAPIHVRLVPLNDKVLEGAHGLADRMRAEGLRVEVDEASESVNYKIRRGTLEKVPWMAVVGPRELDAGTISIRTRGGSDRRGIPLEEFLAEAREAVSSRALDAE
jgi:threonyl-tRNA synthetase